jgi:hypothetical protein
MTNGAKRRRFSISISPRWACIEAARQAVSTQVGLILNY